MIGGCRQRQTNEKDTPSLSVLPLRNILAWEERPSRTLSIQKLHSPPHLCGRQRLPHQCPRSWLLRFKTGNISQSVQEEKTSSGAGEALPVLASPHPWGLHICLLDHGALLAEATGVQVSAHSEFKDSYLTLLVL